MNSKELISKLSPHLFWDVDRKKLRYPENKKLIVQRVLDYGLMNDWIVLYHHVGINEIAETAITLRDLDDRALSFISLLSGIPEDKFLCYTTKRSTPTHWNF